MEDILRKSVPELLEEETAKSITVIVHGIEIPLDTPMNWAYENLSFADNFLHIVILSKST